MKNQKKIIALACCLIVVLLLVAAGGLRFQRWYADGRIEVNGEIIQRDRRGIRGSDYLAIPNRLEELGFEEHETEELPEKECMKIPVNGYLDEPTGIHCIYEMTYTYNGEVIEASFDVINLERVDNQTFLETAENYLGFCAELPYENSDAEQVRAWLAENISTAGRGRDAARLTIGHAAFELMGSDQDGSCGARTLLISKAE